MFQITWAFLTDEITENMEILMATENNNNNKKKGVKVFAPAVKIKVAVQAWSEDKSLCLRKGEQHFDTSRV